MELLGKSLEDIFQQQQKKFTVKTVCMIGIQILDRLQFIHNKNIIHRDIKPDNFVVGLDNKNYIIYVLDFGLSKKFRSSRTHQHIKFSINKKLTGTARYASINALKGCEQSRRDDLEAIGYVLMYFLRGSLPWQGLPVHKGEDRYKKILNKKKSTSAEELCVGFPRQFVDYINYTRNLEFEADPDYKYLRDLLVSALEDEKSQFDFWYDWFKEKPIVKDKIAIERYIKNNENVSFELKDDKKEKDGETNDNENEKENMPIKPLTTSAANDEGDSTPYSSEVLKTNNAGINIPVDDHKNNDNEKKQVSEDKKGKDKDNNKKTKESKKKGKKEKDRNCLIW
jgi:serine/threonine protein kinase